MLAIYIVLIKKIIKAKKNGRYFWQCAMIILPITDLYILTDIAPGTSMHRQIQICRSSFMCLHHLCNGIYFSNCMSMYLSLHIFPLNRIMLNMLFCNVYIHKTKNHEHLSTIIYVVLRIFLKYLCGIHCTETAEYVFKIHLIGCFHHFSLIKMLS